MTQTYVDSEVQRLQQFLQDEITKSRQLYDENTQLRETLSDRDSYIEQLRAENASTHSTINAYQLREERRKAIWRNKDLIALEKQVAIVALEEVESKRIDITDPMTMCVEQIAARVGASAATVGKKFANLDKAGVLHYTIGATEERNGSYYTPVTVAFTNLIHTPESIHKDPKDKQGGGREKRCLHCNSEDIDLYTVQYCRECRKAGWYGQVGLRKDANVLDAMRAAGRDDVHIHKSAWNAPENNEQTQPFHVVHDALYEKPQDVTQNENILSCNSTIPEHDKMITQNQEDVPLTPPLPETPTILREWLERQFPTGRVIYATGSLKSEEKYITKPAHYQPDIAAYLRGDVEHIYGSHRVRNQDGLTWKLCFEIDQPEYNALASDYLITLAAAGIRAVYWQRARQRGHLEIYFDAPVDPEAARAWVISVCPGLLDIPECYPAQDKSNSPLSWPLWQRIKNEVLPCTAYAMRDDSFIEADITHPDELAQLITESVTPCSLIPPLPPVLEERVERVGGGLMEEKGQVQITAAEVDHDLARHVIDEFNRSHSWEEIADLCGGMTSSGKFAAVWRGEQTASVKPDNGGRGNLAIDYGRTDGWLRKFDKYEAWCLIEKIDKKKDLEQRCSDLRHRIDTSLREIEEKQRMQQEQARMQNRSGL